MTHKRGDLIVVLLYGMEEAYFQSPDWNVWVGETREYTIHCRKTDENLMQDLALLEPDVIVTVSESWKDFKNLKNSQITVRKKWLHFPTFNPDAIGLGVISTYLRNCFEKIPDEQPLVSVFTPVYNIGDIIQRPYNSLINQTYDNWEWILFDDSTDEDTWPLLCKLAENDPRISLYKASKNCGVIGEMKYRCCALSKGDILAELDHDDELTVNCLEWVVKAFDQYPEAGFAFTDSCEVFDTGGNGFYGDTWGFGYGSYRKENYQGRDLLVANSCNINPITIRHIISAPNHIRAWRRDVYFEIGGHNRNIHVVDDYEIMIRSFLHTRMVRIPKLGYIQWYNQGSGKGNTQDARRAEIQRLVRHFRNHYNDQIHQRFIDLGIDDYRYDTEQWDNINWRLPNPEVEQHCTLMADV